MPEIKEDLPADLDALRSLRSQVEAIRSTPMRELELKFGNVSSVTNEPNAVPVDRKPASAFVEQGPYAAYTKRVAQYRNGAFTNNDRDALLRSVAVGFGS